MELIWLAAGIAVGIILGMSLQWRRSEAYIKRLEARVADAEIGHLQTAVAIAWDFLNDDDEDDEDWDEQDDLDMDEMLMQMQSGSHQ